MLPLVMILLFVAYADTDKHKHRRTSYWYPFVIGIISWKQPYVKHHVCSGCVFKQGWVLTAYFCLDVLNLTYSPTGRPEKPIILDSDEKVKKQDDDEEFIYEIQATLLHPDFDKEILFQKVIVHLQNCLSMGQFDGIRYQVYSLARLSTDGTINAIMKGHWVLFWRFGYFVRYWHRLYEKWYNTEVTWDYVHIHTCNFTSRKYEFPAYTVCCDKTYGDYTSYHNETDQFYDFEYYGSIITYNNFIVGISYHPPLKDAITVCNTVANHQWIVGTAGRRTGLRYNVDVSLGIDFEDSN